MGQAATAGLELLPDPTTEPLVADAAAPATGNPANADDLLSKLAGDEIDRLLSDADQPAPIAASPVAAPVATAPANIDPPVTAPVDPPAPVAEAPTIDAPTGPASSAAQVLQAPPVATEGVAEQAVQAELNTLFAELTGKNEAAAGSAPADSPAAPSPPIAGDDDEPPPTPPEPDSSVPDVVEDAASIGPSTELSGDLSALEAELRETMASPDPVVGSAPPAVEIEALVAEAPPPPGRLASVLLKPLEWLNAPLAHLNPEVRETVGKIAIVTAFNAAVVLVYVLAFRGR